MFAHAFVFFTGHPTRILYWFDRFAGVGQTEHLFGARALANFAFRNRGLCWHRLVWKGKHAHSPSTVAAKPHYFMELDILRTVQNFLEYVPEFWRSKEFRDSLKGNFFWSIDMTFLAEYLATKLAKVLDSDTEDAEEIWTEVSGYISKEHFSVLCQQLLHVASDEKLLMFINDLGSVLSSLVKGYEEDTNTRYEKTTHVKYKNPGKTNWMEVMVYADVQWESLMQPIFCNACFKNGRKILRILQEEEHEEDAISLKRLMNTGPGDERKEHWALRDKIASMDRPAACRYVALEAWVLFYQLSSESAGVDLYEALMEESGIKYLHSSSTREKFNSRDKRRSKSSSKRSRKKKHRRRDSSDAEDSDDELPISDELPKEEQGWLLSIDNYNSTWTKVWDEFLILDFVYMHINCSSTF